LFKEEEEESVGLTNLRECRISAVRKRRRRINETQDNEIKDLKKKGGWFSFLLAMTDANCAPEEKQTKNKKQKFQETVQHRLCSLL
jgi:hypothetical protein